MKTHLAKVQYNASASGSIDIFWDNYMRKGVFSVLTEERFVYNIAKRKIRPEYTLHKFD